MLAAKKVPKYSTRNNRPSMATLSFLQPLTEMYKGNALQNKGANCLAPRAQKQATKHEVKDRMPYLLIKK